MIPTQEMNHHVMPMLGMVRCGGWCQRADCPREVTLADRLLARLMKLLGRFFFAPTKNIGIFEISSSDFGLLKANFLKLKWMFFFLEVFCYTRH